MLQGVRRTVREFWCSLTVLLGLSLAIASCDAAVGSLSAGRTFAQVLASFASELGVLVDSLDDEEAPSSSSGTLCLPPPGAEAVLSIEPRRDHTAASFGCSLVVLAGADDDGSERPALYEDFLYGRNGSTWELPSPARDFDGDYRYGWPPRFGHSSVVFNERMWMIGGAGYNAGGEMVFYEEARMVDRNLTWLGFEVPWVGRIGHSSVVYDERVWVIGGQTEEAGGYRNDVWSATDRQTWLPTDDSGAVAVLANDPAREGGWSQRSGHTSVVFGGRMWILGGLTEGGIPVNDVWSSEDGASWSSVSENGEAPWLGRSNHASVVFDEKMWILGGLTEGGFRVSEVWSSRDGISWEEASSERTPPWHPRSGHAAVVHEERIWIIGGTDRDGSSDEVWSSADGVTWEPAN